MAFSLLCLTVELTDLPFFAAFALTYLYAPLAKEAAALPVEKSVLALLGLGG
ncbi:MAG: hypothetical protein VST68_02105 [Nitrospirota bacterium]|nr:hypothetical protein [Nitrospirota bacterium]